MPVGKTLNFDEKYKNEDHWRYTKNDRCYDIVLLPYKKSFVPEEGTYDVLLPALHGNKWELVEYFLNTYDYSGYEYVGFFDDDIVTDFHSVNYAFELAEQHHMNLFQMSLQEGSYINEPITSNIKDPKLLYTITTYVECMCPVFHASLLDKLKHLLDYFNPWTGWGIDVAFSHGLRTYCNIIHAVTMLHPQPTEEEWLEIEPGGWARKTSYDRNAAWVEVQEIVNNFFLQYYIQTYNKQPPLPTLRLYADPPVITREIARVYRNE